MTQEQAIERVGKTAERALKTAVYHGVRFLWGDSYHDIKNQLERALHKKVGNTTLENHIEGYRCYFATVHQLESIKNGIRMMYQVTFICTIDGELTELVATNTIEARGKSKKKK